MSDHDFSAATAIEQKGDNLFTLRMPAGWEQGRGAFGGAVIGAMARAVIACEPDPTRTVRSVSAELVGPVPAGELEIEVTALRRGSALSAYDVALRVASDDPTDVLAHGSFTLARTRATDREFVALTPPSMPPYESTPVAAVRPPMGPVFTQHVGFRPTGPWPFSGNDVAAAEGYVELLESSSWGPPEWLALADAYWPSLLALESAPRPVVTVGFTCHLFTPPPRGPLYFRARALASSEGFVSETRELWTPDGKLVAINPQLFAIVA